MKSGSGRIERERKAAPGLWIPPLLLLLAGPAPGLQVDGFSSEAVQEAVFAAAEGDTLLFPAREYAFTGTVVIDRSLTLLGAAEIMDVGLVEPGEPNDPPYWDGPPSVCFTEDPDLLLFRVESGAVTFESLKLVGAITHEAGTGDGIAVLDHDRLVVRNCEITRFRKGVDFMNSRRSVVTGSYLHENYRNGFGYGISITGPVMATGGSEVSIYRNEFTFNRHSIASNSPETRFTVENNYFHDNDLEQWQACVDTIPRAATPFAPWCATTSSSGPGPWPSRAAAWRSRATTSIPAAGTTRWAVTPACWTSATPRTTGSSSPRPSSTTSTSATT